ncbi:hypothetical protein DYH09_13275 [bacterium CPR1]|nr:hypothetical protein [bacterium CPR1]
MGQQMKALVNFLKGFMLGNMMSKLLSGQMGGQQGQMCGCQQNPMFGNALGGNLGQFATAGVGPGGGAPMFLGTVGNFLGR